VTTRYSQPIRRNDAPLSNLSTSSILEREIALSGPADVRRLIPAWFGQGTSAGIARPA
jgi:hypothetical protein